MKKFEYYTTHDSLSKEDLNELGLEGWELVALNVAWDYKQQIEYYIFKREIK